MVEALARCFSFFSTVTFSNEKRIHCIDRSTLDSHCHQTDCSTLSFILQLIFSIMSPGGRDPSLSMLDGDDSSSSLPASLETTTSTNTRTARNARSARSILLLVSSTLLLLLLLRGLSSQDGGSNNNNYDYSPLVRRRFMVAVDEPHAGLQPDLVHQVFDEIQLRKHEQRRQTQNHKNKLQP